MNSRKEYTVISVNRYVINLRDWEINIIFLILGVASVSVRLCRNNYVNHLPRISRKVYLKRRLVGVKFSVIVSCKIRRIVCKASCKPLELKEFILRSIFIFNSRQLRALVYYFFTVFIYIGTVCILFVYNCSISNISIVERTAY